MITLFLAALLLAQTSQEAAPQLQTAIAVPDAEARQHLIGERPFLRLAAGQAKGTPFSGIAFLVTVDPTGAVTNAKALPASDADAHFPPELLAEAESLVRAMHYTPFERGGQAVSATFREYVPLLPPEKLPSQHLPFPKVKNLKSVKFRLQRTGCYGSCPAYTVEVHGDGTVIYDGESFVAFTGHHLGTVPRDNVLELLDLFKAADFFSLDDEYRRLVTDNPTYITSIEIGASRKQVIDYVGVEVGMPLSVSRLEDELDRLSGSARWTKGNADTVSALKAEHWDFKSSEAAAALAQVASRGTADALRDLISAGAPVAAKPESGYALVVAARRSDLAMLNALLDAGAAHNAISLDMSLHEAASSGNVEAFRLLVQSGGHVDATDSAGYNILMSAASSGSPAMVKEALKYGYDVNAASYASQARIEASHGEDFANERTALMAAIPEDSYEVEADGVDHAEVVRMLLAAGADPNARDSHGNTALILCWGRADIALLLIKAGADINTINEDGKTAFTNTSNEDVRRVLLEHGATPQDH